MVLAVAERAEMNRVAQWAQNTASKQILTVLALAASIPCWAQTPVPTSAEQRDRIALVSLLDRKLAVIDNGVVVATFQVAVGADVSPSPTGEFTIVSRVSNPTYYHRGTVIPTGKDNPVGTRWLGLSLKGYGIHGTNAPRSIGRAASHGCIRLRNRDMERLFTMLKVGDAVRIRSERDEEVARVFGGTKEDAEVTVAENTTHSNDQQEERQGSVGLGN
jgi:lipoprotein-anchoring transpeptidase ErfK/SrfK